MCDHWQPNDLVIHRYVGHHDWISWGRPHVVICDKSDLVILCQPAGTIVERFDRLARARLNPWTSRMNVLRFMFPGRAHAVLLFFDAGTGVPSYYEDHFNWPDGRFKGWKIDLESSFQRTEIGFDTTDNALDVIVRPDFTWHWKDEVGISDRLETGVYLPEETESFYKEGRKAIQAMESGELPFCDPWPEWEPPTDVRVPVCTSGWESVGAPGIDLNRNGLYPGFSKGIL